MIRATEAYPVIRNASPPSAPAPGPATVPFSEVFTERLKAAGQITFSAHATQRLRDRNVQLNAGEQSRIASAVDEAAAKGSRETLVLTDKLALVVSVPNRTVITVMPTNEVANTVFTNIDSAVVATGDAHAAQRTNN